MSTRIARPGHKWSNVKEFSITTRHYRHGPPKTRLRMIPDTNDGDVILEIPPQSLVELCNALVDELERQRAHG